MNKKGSVDYVALIIATLISFTLTAIIMNKLFKFNIIKSGIILFTLIFGIVLVGFIIICIYSFWHSHKDWLSYYKDEISEKTIKSLLYEIDNYSLIEKEALRIYLENSDDYISSYSLCFSSIDKVNDKKYEDEILLKFKESLPSLLNNIKEMKYIPFEENNYSVVNEVESWFGCINVQKDCEISYEFDEDIESIVNSKIMKKIIEKHSNEKILAYTVLYLFYGDIYW